jgi:integrase
MVWGERITEKVIWHVVKESVGRAGIAKLSPHDCRRTCPAYATRPAANWSRSVPGLCA